MKIAFFSDIHANLPALQAVLADLDSQQPDAVYCLGDLVGYNVWPNEVIDLVRKRTIPTIAGNYDEGVGLNSDDCGCAYKTDAERQAGAISIAFTNAMVSEVSRDWLRQLPRQIRLEFQTQDGPFQVLMAHGSPRKINEYLFEDRPEGSLLRILRDARADILLVGHTHKPYHRILHDVTSSNNRHRHVVNLGSVGKPKDGDPRACYVVLHFDLRLSVTDPLSLQVEFRRVEYDVEQAAKAVEDSPLPDVYAEALRLAQ